MLTSVTPSNTCDLIISRYFTKFLNLGCASAPDINCSVKSYCKYVLRTPIYQIEIKIIFELRSIKYFEWHLVDLSDFILALFSTIIMIHVILFLVIAITMFHLKWIKIWIIIISWLRHVIWWIAKNIFVKSQYALCWLCLKTSWWSIVIVIYSWHIVEAAHSTNYSRVMVEKTVDNWCVHLGFSSSHSHFWS
jgi:hypothetical protein